MTIMTGLLAWLLAGAGIGTPGVDGSCGPSGSTMTISGTAAICDVDGGAEGGKDEGNSSDGSTPVLWDLDLTGKISNGF